VGDAAVGVGNHDVEGSGLRLLREWFPFEVLHFPVRSTRQLEDKFLRRATSPDGQHIVRALDLLARGERDTLFAETMVDDAALAEGLAEGTHIRDVRLRNALRGLASEGRLPAHHEPTLRDDADLAEDADVVLEHDSAVVAERRCAELERAVALLEGRAFVASRLARRLRFSAGSADN
jgi:hypothetical protein